MRQIVISVLIVLSAFASAAASDRYPTAKNYVTQTGQVVTIGQASHIVEISDVPVRRVQALPTVQMVPVRRTPRQAILAPRQLAQDAPTGGSLFGAINVDPKDWPSGRKCCRPGEPYFNEEPNS